MNRVFRIIWSKALRTWVIASELATRSGKGGGGADVDERGDAASPSRRFAMGGWQMRICAAAVLLALYLPAQAADWYWDADATGTSNGGLGTWNTSLNLWSDNSSPTLGPYRAWNNAAIDNAIFGGTAGEVALGVPIVAHNLTFNVHNYSLTGGQLTLAGTAPTIFGHGNTTISSVIAGTAGLTKEGAGILTLSGANTFSGGIFHNAGWLYATNDAALGAASNVITTKAGVSVGFLVTTGPVNRTVVIGDGGTVVVNGAAGQARYTGNGNVNVSVGQSLTNNTSTYTGTTRFNGDNGVFTSSFSSVADLGVASALGAPTTVANGTILFAPGGQYSDNISYTGTGHRSNRNWVFGGSQHGRFYNNGTGKLLLDGDMTISSLGGVNFQSVSAGFDLLGVLSGAAPSIAFTSSAAGDIVLGGANTFTGVANIAGGGKVVAPVLADTGTASSLGSGSAFGIGGGGTLSYTGGATSSNRTWSTDNGTFNNDGSGALTLIGAMTRNGGTFTLGGSYAGTNTISGAISGTGTLRSNGSGTWVLSGANTFSGPVLVDAGTLQAGGASAFGSGNAFTINGGTLDLNGYNTTSSALSGTGGTVALGSGNLTVNSTTNTTYSGSITGSGGLTKLGATSTLTLKGANQYTGTTTVGGGTLALDFTGAGGPTSNIISSASKLDMAGGTLAITGASGETNTQTFNGMEVTSGNNTLRATSTGGGNLTVNLGTITQSGGILSFVLPTAGGITTTNAEGALGGWATINGTDYAQVVGGRITALTTYANKDNAATWLTGDILSDEANAANTPYFGTVASNVQLGGLKYTAAANSTVTVGAANTLGVNGTILVAPSVGNNRALTITGGSITGGAGGGALGVQQNGGTGTNFTIASTIVDNPANAPGQGTNFVKSGTGLVTLSGPNSYTGSTTVSGGVLSVGSIANGGAASSIGASSADASNLMVQGATLRYTGGTTTTDRGFTIARNGPVTVGTIDVTQGATDLRFDGQVVSTDGAGLTKTGAGRLILSNGNNNYTGITTVSGGTLSVDDMANGGANSGIGASSSDSANLMLQNGGELEYTGATAGTDRGFTLGTGGGAVDVDQGATTLTVGGTVAGTGTLTKNGLGTLLLSGTNTFSGGGLINGGVLQAGSNQAFGTGGWTITSGATLDLNDFNNTVGELAGSGTVDLGSATLTINGGGSFTFSGSITGTGGVASTGQGIQLFSGCGNTYTGATTINDSMISTNCLANGGFASGIGASSAASANLSLSNNGALHYTGTNVTIDRGITLGGGWGYLGMTSGTTLGFTGAVVGSGGLVKRDQGTLVLSGTNTYTGGTSIEVGILRAGSTSAFGTGGVTLSNTFGTTLDLSNFNNTVGYLQGGGAAGSNVALGSATLTISNGGAAYAGAISGAGGLVKNGGGAQTLSGCNSSYTGSTVINAGYIIADCLRDGGVNSSIGASTAGPSSLVINNGGILRYTGTGDSTNRQFTLGEAGNSYIEAYGTGAINFTSTAPIEMIGTGNRNLRLGGANTDDNTLAAQIDNPGTGVTGLVKYHAGTWVLNNANSTYTGVTDIQEGVLAVTDLADGGQASSIGSSLNTADKLIVRNLATLRYVGTGDSTDRLMTLVNGNVFLESSGTGAVRFTNQGAVALSGNATHVVTFGGTYTGDNLFAGRFADVGTNQTSIAKNGAGTWILTGNSTHTGNTVINDGNLVIGDGSNSGNLGTGNVIVDQATSTLSINRNDTFNFASTISGPGALAQIGAGTTVLTSTGNSIGAARVSNGMLQVDGGLSTSSIAMTNTSALTVNGTVEAAGGTASAITGDAGANTITVNAGGTLRTNGDLGGGSDVVTVSGTLDTGAAALNLGDGNDTLALNDSAVITGAGIDGGLSAGDILQVNNVAPRTISGSMFAGFERLIKQGLGILTATGNHLFSAGTDIAGGTLDVDGSVTTPTVTMADGTTLNVDGTLEAAGGTTAALTGSAGINTVQVNTSATLRANGDLGDGDDAVTLAGTLDTGAGTLNLGSGDDTLTLNDGAVIAGTGIDAGSESVGDTLVLNNASALAFDGGQTANFEQLVKQNAGTATMTGTQSFTAGTTISGGGLDVDGSLTTPTVDMTGDTALNVDGSLQGVGGIATEIAGDGGAQTVSIAGTATATGDLGGGNDTLDVTGTLNIVGGVFALGDGDDNFVVHDGTVVNGTIDGGAGLDSRTYDINTTANLGALSNFEGVIKSGTGTLNINGPGATDLQEVEILGGTLNIGVGASVVATAGSPLNTTVGSGATLNVDGAFGCGADADTMTVGGAITGSGTIDMCGGDDTLTLNDGADLSGFGGTLDGGAHSVADRVVLNNAGAMTFSAYSVSNFEILQKDNAGEATLTGVSEFSGGTLLNGGTLTVTGTLLTPTLAMGGGTTLNVEGFLADPGLSATTISGGAGVQTVNIVSTARATGDLGADNDVLDVTGTLDTAGGVFSLGDGDDQFVVHDGTNVIGTIDGGAGMDSRVYDINTMTDLGSLLNFEGVTKTGTGVLNINGPGATDLQDVEVLGGTLNIGVAASVAATSGSALNTVVGSGATLNVDGNFGCGAQADTMTVSGTVSGTGTINLCGGDDTLTLNDGAVLANVIDGDAGTADTVVLNNAGAMTFDGANTVNFEILQKDNVGEATLTGVSTYTGGALLNGGTLTVAGDLTTPTVAMGDGTTLNVDGALQGMGGTAAAITGSGGVNTVNVAAGATLTATGDLGGGNDVLDAAGTIDTAGGVFSLGAGDDTFNVYDTTDTSLATIDGGLGNDTLDVTIGLGNTVPLGGLLGFESLGKSGLGTLEIHGASNFIDVDLNAGTLRVTDTGSVSATNTTILAGATLELADNGSYNGTAGDDTFTVAGTVVSTGSNTGTIDLGGGNDTFTIQDGADLSGLAQPISGGAGTDNFVADLAGTATLGGATDFETLTKTNAGTLIVAGPAMSNFSTVNVLGGMLDVGVGGSLAGVQTATVASGAALNVDGVFGFTAGADNFTVAGTVTGASIIDMLDGDDTFTIQDGADLSGLAGPVDGGAGNDTFVSDIAGTATLGGAVNFEALNKTNVGTLIVAGPAASAFTTVNVAGGTLDIGVNGAIDGVATGSVAGGATMNVDGRYTGSAGNDTLTVAGAVSGSGDIALGDGDDTLTLNDGADLSGLGGLLDGGAHGGGDRVVLNNAGAMNFDAGNVVNFEFLQKDNTGNATLTGTSAFSGGTDLNGGMLTVTGSLTTSIVRMAEGTALDVDGAVDANFIDMADDTALNVDGTLQSGAGASTAITGSDGVNTVTITGSAVATGMLGAGNDVLDVAGTLNTNGGTFALGDGDDDFVVHDGTVVTGIIDGGAGLDSRVYDIAGNAEFGALLNFEGVTKRGTGTLNISGPGATDLQSVEVEGGTLNIGAAGSVVATAGSALNTVVGSGATLNVDGSFGCGDQADTMTVAGTVSGTGTVAMCRGNDTLTLQDGATLASVIDGGADTDTVVLDTATAMSLDAAQTINFEVLQKDNVGEATLTGTSTFSGGTLLNGGALTVTGELITPTVALADGTTLNVGGSLHGDGDAAALTGSAGANTVNVSGDLFATGDLGGGDDIVDVSGSLNTGSGSFGLGDGNDTLTIHDGTEIIGTVVAGAGNDTFNTDIATNADLGAVQGFETLSKTGAGTLDIHGPASSDFTTVNVLAGTVNVTSGGSVVARNSTVAADATLQIAGSYSGTAGDDSFTSMGTVRGALGFGAGADTARFVGGDVSGLTVLDGGAGTSDLLSFSGLDLDDSNASVMANWERVELLNDSALTLGTAFTFGDGVLAIDATSQLFANAGASIGGSVENAGSIDVGANRLGIGGGYSSNGGTLQLTVSPGSASSGGLNVLGDVVGTTNVVFDSDGSSPAEGTNSILVISSPNDNAATAGGFAPAGSADGLVRLQGSPFPWNFEQQSDRNWYLGTDASEVLPEIAGYGVLPGLGALMSQRGGDLAHQRLAGARGAERPRCGEARSGRSESAGTDVVEDCRGVWVAASATEVELGADPGFEVTGDDTGLYVGVDGALERENTVLRGGAYLGYMHSVYWATGVNSSAVSGMGPARIDLDTPMVGLYGTSEWDNGSYVDLVLTGQRPRAEVRTADGFGERIEGDTLTLSARYGHRYSLDNGWMLEPQVQLSGSRVQWDDKMDAGGRQLMFDDDLVATARAALRVEKSFATAGGAQIRPWATIAVQNVFGGNDNGLRLAQSGVAPSAFPGHDLGTSANVDVGLEAAVDRNVSFFGAISIGQDLKGSDYEQRGLNLGMRVRW